MTTPDCRRTRDLLAQLVAGEIEGQVGREIEAHLRACPACSAESAGLREALSLLKAEVPPDPGVPYWSTFGTRLRARIAASQRRRRTLRLTAAAAAVLLVASLALVRLQRESPAPVIAKGPTPSPTSVTVECGATPAPPVVAHEPRPAATQSAPGRAPSVAEAEARLDALLRQAADEGQDPGEVEAILDELAPAHPLDGADALGRLSPEEDRSLSEDLLDPQG